MFTDYPTSFFLQNVRTSFEARQQMAWGSKGPEFAFPVTEYFLFAHQQ